MSLFALKSGATGFPFSFTRLRKRNSCQLSARASTLYVSPFCDNAEYLLGAVFVLEIAVQSLPRPIVEEAEPPGQEEGVGSGLTPAGDPLALGGHRQEGPGVQERGGARGTQRHLAAGLAAVDLKKKGKNEDLKKGPHLRKVDEILEYNLLDVMELFILLLANRNLNLTGSAIVSIWKLI